MPMVDSSGKKIPGDTGGSVIRAILEGISTAVGEQFFAALVVNLASH